ncbi:MAG: hypothetical protein GW760_04340 [Legionella sp.]|nr:hypothetical protein [Legionella sp.]
MNHNVITGWIVAIFTAIGLLITAVLYIGNINGKLLLLEDNLKVMTNRMDGLYIYIAEQGGSVKKAVMSSNLDATTKDRIIKSFLPKDSQLKSNSKFKKIKN